MSKKIINVPLFKCEKCGHEWITKKIERETTPNNPKLCPKCKSKKWNTITDLCSVCGIKKVYGKYGICRDCQKEYKRLYNLIIIQAEYQKKDYPILYKKRVEDGLLIQVAEEKFTYRNRKKIFDILGNKCYICGKTPNERKIYLHHLKYLNLNRKNLKEYIKFIIPLCTKHHMKLHSLTNRLLKKQNITEGLSC